MTDMSTKYNSFEKFIVAVIDAAEDKCRKYYGNTLTGLFRVPINTLEMIIKIISLSWWAFIALVSLLLLGPLTFALSLLGFASSPIGIIIISLLAMYGGITAIKFLYRNKVLPISVKDTGERFKKEFESHIDDIPYIDSLIDRASDFLLSKTKK